MEDLKFMYVLTVKFFFFLGGKYSPKFETLTEGFTCLKMITRTNGEHHGTPPPSSKTPTHPYAWDGTVFLGSESDDLETGKDPCECVGQFCLF
jgi:hypothetical protein